MRGRILSPRLQGSRRAALRGAFATAALASAAPAWLSGCAGARPGVADGYRPMLMRVTVPGSKGPAWLFGSIHAGADNLYPLPGPVTRAWQASTRLAVEIDPVARAHELRGAYARMSVLPRRQRIEDLVGVEATLRIRRHFGFDDARWKHLSRLQPWALGLRLLQTSAARQGLDPALGIDRHFVRRAGIRGLAITELEQALEQLRAIAGGTPEAQAAELLARFERLRRAPRAGHGLMAAWRAGDAAALEALKDETFGPIPAARQRMFGDRDQRIASRFVALVRRIPDVFAVVGALHLVGPDGLPSLLSRAGASIEPHDYGAPA
ncbi:MAG: TraB/GumN family protein [Burkholderiaceae bacterium]|nr:TraB/GumN family protein [Burkholderiaceae bacterium]